MHHDLSNIILMGLAFIGTPLFGTYVIHDACRKLVRIGIPENPDLNKVHGFIRAQAIDGSITKVPFVVDRPERLEKSTDKMRRHMWFQAVQLGFIPTHIEIIGSNRIRTYQLGKRRPVSVQPRLAIPA